MIKENDAWVVQDEWENEAQNIRHNKMLQSIRQAWHARMKKQDIDQCITRVAKVCARGDNMQCMINAWKMYMWGKVCLIHNQWSKHVPNEETWETPKFGTH